MTIPAVEICPGRPKGILSKQSKLPVDITVWKN